MKSSHSLRRISDPFLEAHLFQKRVLLGALCIVFGFLILGLRLFYLQILKYPYYANLSYLNSVGVIPIPPARGLILDRHGKVLAENLPVFSLDVTADKTPDLETTLESLKVLFDLDNDDLDRFYRQLGKQRSFNPLPLKVQLTEDEIARFYVNQYRFPGVEIHQRLIRHYPDGKNFVTVLGYTGRINQRELDKVDPQAYLGIDYIGKEGIERYFEDTLRGTPGYQEVEMNAQRQPVKTLKTISPIAGKNLSLTLDADLQEAAVKAMKNYPGALIALDPHNGEILAMVSNPAYDPNLFVKGISQKDYAALTSSPDQPLFNRAIRGQYPPGSVIKPFVALEALEAGFTTPKTAIYDPGYFEINAQSRRYRDWKSDGHGWVNLRTAIAVSCDTYFYTLAAKMGITPITHILELFGYGKLTGIEMKEEMSGMIPSPQNKRRLMSQPWYTGDTLNSAIGQGLTLFTPLQLAVGTAAIANRGTLYKPTLLLNSKPEGKSILLKKENWESVIAGMEAVVNDPEGTGYRFGIPHYTVAAKTGTAQLFQIGQNQKYIASKISRRLRDNSMFMAFAPVENPQIVVAVAIQNAPNAPEIARQVMDYYLLTEKKLPETE